MIHWITLDSNSQIDTINTLSIQKPIVIFKHSTRCSISIMAKNRLERECHSDEISFYMLDLLTFRQVSDEVAKCYEIQHESPQLLLIKNAKCIYVETHNAISYSEVLRHLVIE